VHRKGEHAAVVCSGGQEFIRAIELALNELTSPLTVAQECLTQRENRAGVDKVRDDVEVALIKVRRKGEGEGTGENAVGGKCE